MDAIIKRLMENHRVNKMTEAYKIRYSYDGDELSDYEGNLIVVADSEDEAISKAEKEYPEGWNFRVEDEITDLEDYKKRFPRSNIKIVESVDSKKFARMYAYLEKEAERSDRSAQWLDDIDTEMMKHLPGLSDNVARDFDSIKDEEVKNSLYNRLDSLVGGAFMPSRR